MEKSTGMAFSITAFDGIVVRVTHTSTVAVSSSTEAVAGKERLESV